MNTLGCKPERMAMNERENAPVSGCKNRAINFNILCLISEEL